MSKIIKFPSVHNPSVSPIHSNVENITAGKGKRLSTFLLRFIWVVTVLVWPVLKWILSIEVFYRLIRMWYHWNTPDVYVGWTFLSHFLVLTALTYYVSIYKPR